MFHLHDYLKCLPPHTSATVRLTTVGLNAFLYSCVQEKEVKRVERLKISALNSTKAKTIFRIIGRCRSPCLVDHAAELGDGESLPQAGHHLRQLRHGQVTVVIVVKHPA